MISLRIFSAIGALVYLFTLSTVSAQNCGFVGTNETTFEADPMNETSAANVLLWRTETFNVVGSQAANTPHVRYVTGLRYETTYEYVTSQFWREFIDTERVGQVQRNVTFNCADGGFVQYYFLFNVIDENNKPPTFGEELYNYTVARPWNVTNPINSVPIMVTDADFNVANANLTFTTNVPNDVIATGIPTWSEEVPPFYSYNVSLYFVRAPTASSSVFVIANDGANQNVAQVSITVT